jgi:hypothetical protein
MDDHDELGLLSGRCTDPVYCGVGAVRHASDEWILADELIAIRSASWEDSEDGQRLGLMIEVEPDPPIAHSKPPLAWAPKTL